MVEQITIKNKVLGKSLAIARESTPDYVLKSVDWGVIKASYKSYRFLNEIGEFVTNISLGTRDLTIEGWVLAGNKELMTRRKNFLNLFFNPQHLLTLEYKTYSIDFLCESTIRYSTKESENNEVVCAFKVEGFCADPLFSSLVENKIPAASTDGAFHFPLIMSQEPAVPGGVIFGERKPSLIVKAVNNGSVVVGMRIVFFAKGSVVNPKITNAETQRFFKINKTLEVGEIVEINTNTGSKSVKGFLGGVESNYFKYKDLDSDWLQLQLGENFLRYGADAQEENLDVFVYFYDKFLEVQEWD